MNPLRSRTGKSALFIGVLVGLFLFLLQPQFERFELQRAVGTQTPCALIFRMNPAAWNHIPWVMIHYPRKTVLLTQGDVSIHVISPNCYLTYDSYQPAGAAGLTLGFTQWLHCDELDAQQPVVVPKGSTYALFVPVIHCECPKPGMGLLTLLAVGTETEAKLWGGEE